VSIVSFTHQIKTKKVNNVKIDDIIYRVIACYKKYHATVPHNNIPLLYIYVQVCIYLCKLYNTTFIYTHICSRGLLMIISISNIYQKFGHVI